MKKIALVIFETLFFVVLANGQRIILVSTIEKTVVGNQYGLQLLLQTKSQWNFGGFYQTAWQQTTEGVQTVNPFYGICVNAPLAKSDKINFYFNLRGGVVNQFFLAVAPGLETKLKISKIIGISTLMSIRMSYPSASLKIYITL
jgi:hypothetical protein